MKQHVSFFQIVDVDLEHPSHLYPTTSAEGCWVCGVQTSQQCAVCASAGFVSRFCSPEHQRLVWPAHKTVCGAASASFALPPLEDGLHAIIVSNKHAPFPYNLRPADDAPLSAPLTSRLVTVAQYLELRSGMKFVAAMKLARQDSRTPNPTRRRVIFTCQEILIRFLYGGEPDLRRMFSELGSTGAFWAIRPQLDFYRRDFPEPIYVQFLHRALTLAALTIALSNRPHDTNLATSVKHSSEQYLRAAVADMRFPTPERAVKFLRSLSQVIHPVACVRVPWITGVWEDNGGIAYWTLSHVSCWLDFSPHEAGECIMTDFLACEPGVRPSPATVVFPGPPPS